MNTRHTVERWVERFNAGDHKGIAALYADDAVNHQIALCATQWQTISRQVLPASIAGIATGVILAVSQAIGETAPLCSSAPRPRHIHPQRFLRQVPGPACADLQLLLPGAGGVHRLGGGGDHHRDA